MTVVLILAASCLLVLVAVQLSGAGIRSLRVAQNDGQYRQQIQLTNRRVAQLARLESELLTPSGAKGAVPWRIVEVREIVPESADCKSFYLADPHGQALPDYLAGQYLMVRPALATGKQITRCYSLSDTACKEYWRISVKRQMPSVTQTPGAGGLSVYLHDCIHVGDCLLVGGPAGQFYLSPNVETPLVLMAAGIGVTPIVAMLRWSLVNTPNRPVLILFQVKDTEHWPFGEQLHQWQATSRNLKAVTYFSCPDARPVDLSANAWKTGKYTAGDVVRMLRQPELANYYMCGPDQWMTNIREGLIGLNVPQGNIHWESFGGATQKNGKPRAHSRIGEVAQEFKVDFSLSQQSAVWADAEQSIWEFARANDVELPSGCLSGACGSCKLKLLKGSVRYDRPVSAELAEGECLPCVARPASDLVLEA